MHTIKTLINDEGLTLNKVKKLLNEKKDKTEVDSKIDKYINQEQLKKIKKIISEIKEYNIMAKKTSVKKFVWFLSKNKIVVLLLCKKTHSW